MTPANLLQDITRALQSDSGFITDPGAGGTIRTLLRGWGVCKVRTLTAETRALDDANNLVAGQLLFVTLESDGGDLTITGAGNGSIVLQQEGQGVLFFAGELSTGVVQWWAINPQSGAYGYGINVKAQPFNAKGDGSTDDSAALQAAADAAKLLGTVVIGPEGTYKITSNVTMRDVAVDFSLATVSVSGTTTKLIIGGHSNHQSKAQKFYKIQRTPAVNSNPTCQVLGSKDQSFTIDFCDYLQLYANTDTSVDIGNSDASIAYCTFNLLKCDKLEITNNASTNGSSVQWINENTFNIKRTKNLIVSGTYAHNHNYFYTGAFEDSGGTIDFEVGHSNILLGIRSENLPTVTFASGTHSNMLVSGYSTLLTTPYTGIKPGTVTDSGTGNIVTRYQNLAQNRIPIIIVNPRTCQTYTNNTGTGRVNFTSLRGVDVQRNNADDFKRALAGLVFDSPLIPVSVGDCINFTADVSTFRCTVTAYNSSRVQLLEANFVGTLTGFLSTLSGLNYNSGSSSWISSSDIGVPSAGRDSATYAIVVNSNVAFLKFDIKGAGTSASPFKEFAVHKITLPTNPLRLADCWQQAPRNPAATASPTVGFANEIGMKVSKTSGGWFTATTAVDTTLAVAAAAADGTVTVTTTTGATGFGSMATGDVIGIALDDGTTHWTTINGAPSAGVVTLTAAIPALKSAAIGNRVTTNAWAAT